MGSKVAMIGKKFGRWEVLEETSERTQCGSIKYLCRCDCGKTKIVSGVILRRGESTSCGCYNREVITKANKVTGDKLYGIYSAMKQRCYNKNDKAYHNYGGRGIKVCREWLNDSAAFREWALSHGYMEGLWLDRKDNAKGYSPENCRFITPKEQQRNKRTNRIVAINGEMHTVMEWAEISKVPYMTLLRRLKLGWSGQDLLRPVDKKLSHSHEIKQGIYKWRDTRNGASKDDRENGEHTLPEVLRIVWTN